MSMDNQDYEIALDEQVVKYLDIRHKHTYFLITAAIAVLAFVLSFSSSNKLITDISSLSLVLLCVGAITSLAVAGVALWSLHLDNQSFELHLKYRHQKKKWSDLSDTDKKSWDILNQKAQQKRKSAIALLTISVFANSFFVASQLLTKGARTVHHYGETSTEIVPHQDHFEVIFTNKETGQKIHMTIPRVGSKEDPSKGLTIEDVKNLSEDVNKALKKNLS